MSFAGGVFQTIAAAIVALLAFFHQNAPLTQAQSSPRPVANSYAAAQAQAAAVVAAVDTLAPTGMTQASVPVQTNPAPIPASQQQSSPSQLVIPAPVHTSSDISALSSRLGSLTNIVGSLASLIPSLASQQNQSATVSQWVAANGNPNAIGAGAAINQLTNVTITNPNITGLSSSAIPDLSGKYLSLSGGAVTGTLTTTGSFGIGTTSPSDKFALNGAAYLADISAPSVTTNRLYSSAGNLYWAGSIIGGSVGSWTLASGNVYRLTGNVGIGTSSPAYALDVNGILQAKGFITQDPYVDVRAFGAKGDGSTDDTAAIVAAIAATAGYTTNGTVRSGTVFFPCGTYNFTGLTITVPVIFQGAGETCTILKYTQNTGTAITENYQGTLNDSFSPGLRDLELKGTNSNFANSQSTTGLLLGGTNGAARFLGRSIRIDAFGTGLSYGNNAYLTSFQTSLISSNYVNFTYPAGLTNSGENLVFRDTTFADTGEVYTSGAGACVQIQGGIVMAVFDGGSFDDCRVDIPANSGSHVSFTNNHFEWPGGYLNQPFITINDFYSTVSMTSPNFYLGRIGAATTSIQIAAGTLNIYGMMSLNAGTSTLAQMITVSGTANLNVYGTGRLVGYTKLASNTGTGKLYISDYLTNNIGIGTTSPTSLLDVGGYIDTTSLNGGYKIDNQLALYASTTNFATFVGQGAGAGFVTYANSSSIGNGTVAVGYQAMQNASSTVNPYSVAVGYQALQGSGSNISAVLNTAVGYQALRLASSGSYNVAVGWQALALNTAGSSNVAMGVSALVSNTGGVQNTAVGTNALQWNQTGSNSTAVGYLTGGAGTGAASSFSNGTFLGANAGRLQTGNNNTFIGTNAASSTVGGSNNIAIGYDISLPVSGGSNQLDIGNIIYGTGIAGEAFTTAGNIGIGTSTPYSRLSVWGPDTASTTAFQVVNNASTTAFAVYDNGNATYSGSIFQSSDQRLKTNIQSLDASTSLSLIKQLNPVTYNWADPNKGTSLQYGFIAQQVLPVFPDLIATTSPTNLTPDGTLTLNYVGLISPIVKAIQALSMELSSIENTIAGFATIFHTNELCVGSTCVTSQQFAAMVAAANQAGAVSSNNSSTTSVAATSTPSTPPIIKINGDNPAVILVGTTYNDLGATITGPSADLNLGIHTFVNGEKSEPVQIDTSVAGTSTVDYVVTDQNGLTATSTRVVVVQSSVQAPLSVTSSSVATSTSSQ